MIIPTLASQKDTKKDCTQNQSEWLLTLVLKHTPTVDIQLYLAYVVLIAISRFVFTFDKTLKSQRHYNKSGARPELDLDQIKNKNNDNESANLEGYLLG